MGDCEKSVCYKIGDAVQTYIDKAETEDERGKRIIQMCFLPVVLGSIGGTAIALLINLFV